MYRAMSQAHGGRGEEDVSSYSRKPSGWLLAPLLLLLKAAARARVAVLLALLLLLGSRQRAVYSTKARTVSRVDLAAASLAWSCVEYAESAPFVKAHLQGGRVGGRGSL